MEEKIVFFNVNGFLLRSKYNKIFWQLQLKMQTSYEIN